MLETKLLNVNDFKISWRDDEGTMGSKDYFDFQVYVPEILLAENLKFDPNLPCKIFPEVVDKWQKHLKKYTKSLPKKYADEKEWIKEDFLDKKLEVIAGYKFLIVEPDCIKITYSTDKTGFVWDFDAHNDFDGSMSLGPEFRKNYSNGRYCKWDFTYRPHNVGRYTSSSLFRELIVDYLNECLKQVTKQ